MRVCAASREGRTEDERIAPVRDVGTLPHELKEPGPVGGIAVEDRAGDPVVLEDDSLVDAPCGVPEHDVLALRAARKIAGGEEVDAGHLQLRACDGGDVDAFLPASVSAATFAIS